MADPIAGKEVAMLGKLVATIKNVVVGCARSIGDTMKRLVEPARALTGAAR